MYETEGDLSQLSPVPDLTIPYIEAGYFISTEIVVSSQFQAPIR